MISYFILKEYNNYFSTTINFKNEYKYLKIFSTPLAKERISIKLSSGTLFYLYHNIFFLIKEKPFKKCLIN